MTSLVKWVCLHYTIAEFSCSFFKLYLEFNSRSPFSEFSGSYFTIYRLRSTHSGFIMVPSDIGDI